jgi:hypothetical protein
MTNLEAIDNINEIAIVGMAGRFPKPKISMNIGKICKTALSLSHFFQMQNCKM